MNSATATAPNFVAEVNGHYIYRAEDGEHCNLWTRGVGWWGFDLNEEQAHVICEATSLPAEVSR